MFLGAGELAFCVICGNIHGWKTRKKETKSSFTVSNLDETALFKQKLKLVNGYSYWICNLPKYGYNFKITHYKETKHQCHITLLAFQLQFFSHKHST